MDSTKVFPLFEPVRRLRPAAARHIACHPQAITAVAVYFSRAGAPMYVHEKVTLSAVAESIARLSGYQYAGVFDANKHSTRDLFFVPDDTLKLDEARDLGIDSPRQIYGAVVPYPFAKTKAITHRLINTDAPRPHGWSATFAENVSNAVLPGYTVFEVDGARTAAMRLLSQGPVRIKEPLGDGGHGQTVVTTILELNALLEKLTTEKIARHGLVLETNLRRVTKRRLHNGWRQNDRLSWHATVGHE